ncbi:MAG: NUDIX hydrolase [Elainellaceae cyanobacterium]
MTNSNTSPVEVAIAILMRGDRFLLQLRDDIPGILYPGHWGFFGGHLDPGETPDVALIRELKEEINYRPPYTLPFLCQRSDGPFGTPVPNRAAIRHVFVAPLTVSTEELTLAEGWDFDLLSADDIKAGQCYSNIAQRVCPIGKPHRQILLDFIQVLSAGYSIDQGVNEQAAS